MQLFVIGAPRSGTTIVTQFLNRHERIRIFDEIDLLAAGRPGGSATGTWQAFLHERGAYQAYLSAARQNADPAVALRVIMSELAHPCSVWGEKNPWYATRLHMLTGMFPEAAVLFVLRDPREVVNSLLLHRDSPHRTPLDFWIKDTVAQALALTRRFLQPLEAGDAELAVLRYEDFTAGPTAALDAALGQWGLTFSDTAVGLAHPPPETVGDHQFFRCGVPLPWKEGNLRPLRRVIPTRDRIDADDPAWAQVDALARCFGYD